MNLAALTPVLIRIAAIVGLADQTGAFAAAIAWLIKPPDNTNGQWLTAITLNALVPIILFVLLFAFADRIGRYVYRTGTASVGTWASGRAKPESASNTRTTRADCSGGNHLCPGLRFYFLFARNRSA